MPWNRKKKRISTPPLPAPAPRRSVPPLPRKARVLIQLVAIPMYLVALALAYAVVRSFQTGVATGSESVTAADQPFVFYLIEAVNLALALYAGWLGISVARAK
jgi:hypothetical protein